MELKKPARLPIALALAATTALSFGGGVMWNSAAQTAAAAEAPATQHGWLGLQLAPATDGLTVADVVADGPAAKAGVLKGDVIKSINGTAATDQAALRTMMMTIKPGDVVQLSITRNGANQTIAVTAATAPAGQRGPGGAGGRGGHGGHGGMGFGMPNLPELKDIPVDQRFDHMLGGSFSINDKDGKKVTLRIIPAKVVSATDTEVVVTPNGGTSNSTFKVTADTKVPGKASALKAGDKVVVTAKEGSTDALAVHPAEHGMRQGPPAGTNGQPGHPGQGRRGPGGPNGATGPAAGGTTQGFQFGQFPNRAA